MISAVYYLILKMCFHYSLTKERTEIALQLHAEWEDDFFPVYHANGFDFPMMPVITQQSPKSIQLFQWGLLPHWVKTREEAEKFRTQTLNARCESVFEKPSFRGSIGNNRCLVIADGFFEWMDLKKKKYPHYIYMKDHSIFCFAGIYSRWVDKETGEMINTFSILTTSANPMLEKIHNLKKRMPVIIPPGSYEKWLQKDLPQEEINKFLTPYPETLMENHTISKRITSRTDPSNHPETIEPFTYNELSSLF